MRETTAQIETCIALSTAFDGYWPPEFKYHIIVKKMEQYKNTVKENYRTSNNDTLIIIISIPMVINI